MILKLISWVRPRRGWHTIVPLYRLFVKSLDKYINQALISKPWYIVYYVSTRSEEYLCNVLALYVLWKQQYPPSISRLTLTAESSGDSKDQLKTCKQTHTFSQRDYSLLDCFSQTFVESGVVFLAPLEVLRCKNRQQLTY